jgi:hypothetical protein
MIAAKVDSWPVGSAEVKDGRYTLKIRADHIRLFNGKEITFKIGVVDAKETAILESPGGGELNLTGTIYFTSSIPGRITKKDEFRQRLVLVAPPAGS